MRRGEEEEEVEGDGDGGGVSTGTAVETCRVWEMGMWEIWSCSMAAATNVMVP